MTESETETRYCSDCIGTMSEIHVIDKGHGYSQRPLEYAAGDAKRSIWTGNLPVAGVVKAYACTECGLIKFYAQPKS